MHNPPANNHNQPNIPLLSISVPQHCFRECHHVLSHSTNLHPHRDLGRRNTQARMHEMDVRKLTPPSPTPKPLTHQKGKLHPRRRPQSLEHRPVLQMDNLRPHIDQAQRRNRLRRRRNLHLSPATSLRPFLRALARPGVYSCVGHRRWLGYVGACNAVLESCRERRRAESQG
jgi:hypothetical protein